MSAAFALPHDKASKVRELALSGMKLMAIQYHLNATFPRDAPLSVGRIRMFMHITGIRRTRSSSWRWPSVREDRLRDLCAIRPVWPVDRIAKAILDEFPDLPFVSITNVRTRMLILGISERPSALFRTWPAERISRLVALENAEPRLSRKRMAELLTEEFPTLEPVTVGAVHQRCSLLDLSRFKPRQVKKARSRRTPPVPTWVPDSLAGEYRDLSIEFDECHAAGVVRRLKREMAEARP